MDPKHVRLVPPAPPLAVQSTAIRSASPVSTVKGASIKTERDFLSRISNEGSYARNGRFCEVMVEFDEAADDIGCKIKSKGVGVYVVNCLTERSRQDRGLPPVRVLLTCS